MDEFHYYRVATLWIMGAAVLVYSGLILGTAMGAIH